MSFTDFFIKRPVFATSISLLIVIIGYISFQNLELRQYPKMDANVVSITTTYTGADAETVEGFITTQVENAIAGVDDIDYITSTSSQGQSTVTINFNLNADIDSDIEDINSDITSVSHMLPTGVDTPSVTKVDPDSTPSLVVGFTSTSRTPEEITDYLNRVVIPQITTISGVGSANVLGNNTYAMRLWLDPKKMSALGVTAEDVNNALSDNNIQAQPGEIDRKHQIITLTTNMSMSSVDEFNQLVVKHEGNQFITMKDIGKAMLGAEDDTTGLFINGKNGVGFSVILKSSANPLTTTDNVKTILAQINDTMPKDLSMSTARDASVFIRSSIDEVIRTLVEAGVIVLLVIFVFLGSFRSVIIPVITIPLSLIGAYGIMYACDFSINTLTLLGFVLAIGMVVDDAIVVLENIHRHIENGLSPFNAALLGAKEICFAVIAMTLTLAAVYTPIGFISGFTSILFKEFAFTLAGTIIISGFIALTLTPMMCSKLMLPHDQGINWFESLVNRVFAKIASGYQRLITSTLNNRIIIIFILLGVLALGVIFFIPMSTKSTLAPDEDQGVAIGMAEGPTAANLAYTEHYTNMIPAIYKTIPEIKLYGTINGMPNGQNTAMTFASLTDWSQRDLSAQQIIQDLTQKTSKIPGMQLMYFSPPSLPGSNGMYPVQFVIKTTGTFDELNNVAQQVVQQLQQNPGILRAQSDLKLDNPQLQVVVNRNKASYFGISMESINQLLSINLAQPESSSFMMDGYAYYVIPQASAKYRDNIEAINNMQIATESGELTSLANLVTLKNIVSPNSLNHFQQQRAATINVVLNSNYSQQEAITSFESIMASINNGTMSYDFAGSTRQFLTAGSSMEQIFIFSLLFIYLVLCAQFESFRDPLIVMLTVPLSLVGALVTLYLTGSSLNIYTEIGLITLIGLISKHGILMVEFANHMQLEGQSKRDAIIHAATIRLRPILMTTAAMVLGSLPLILSSGAGANSRQQMGWTIAGGMLFGTLLTLFVIPTMYSLMAKQKQANTIS